MTIKKLGLVASSLVLASCATFTDQQAEQANKLNEEKANRLLKEASQPLPKANMALVQRREGVYLGALPVKRQSGRSLPAGVERGQVKLAAAAPLSLVEIADLLTETSGIPVAFAADVFADTGKAAANEDANELMAALERVGPGGRGLNDQAMAPAAPLSPRERMRVDYQGSLSGFLNLVSAYFDVGWAYRDGRIQYFRKVTRSFALASMPTAMKTSTTLTAGITGGGSGGGGSGSGSGSGGGSGSDGSGGIKGGATQTASVDVALDFWADLQKNLKTIVGEAGSFNASPSSASVTVTAPTSVVDQVADYIQDLNKQLLRQVVVNVEVYSVNVDESTNWQYQLKAVFGSSQGVIGNAGAADNKTMLQFGFRGGSSKILVDALAELGSTSQVTSAAVTTMSGHPVPLQVSNTRGYVSEVGSSSSLNGTTVTMETAQVSSGFALNLLPRVMDEGKVLLQYSINISTLMGKDNGFDNFQVPVALGGTAGMVQLPNIDQRSFIQEGLFENGSTLVLAGFERVENTMKSTGVGTPGFKWLGGGRSGSKTRQVLVILITPSVLDHAGALAAGH